MKKVNFTKILYIFTNILKKCESNFTFLLLSL